LLLEEGYEFWVLGQVDGGVFNAELIHEPFGLVALDAVG
jgi:hypothetical protein